MYSFECVCLAWKAEKCTEGKKNIVNSKHFLPKIALDWRPWVRETGVEVGFGVLRAILTCPQEPVTHCAQGWLLHTWMRLGMRVSSHLSDSGQMTRRCWSPPPHSSEHCRGEIAESVRARKLKQQSWYFYLVIIIYTSSISASCSRTLQFLLKCLG